MKEGYVIQCLGWANGDMCPHEGMYVKEFDHEKFDGQGYGEFTSDISRAIKFDSQSEALAFYLRSPMCKPLRSDGNPNRPMTAMTVVIIPQTTESDSENDEAKPVSH